MRRTKHVAAVAAVALVVVGTGAVAVAAVPSADGTINACRSTLFGTLRVIDAEAGQQCRNGERPLNWSQQGPQGPAGPAGEKGDRGEPGPSGAQTKWAVIDLDGALVSGSGVVSSRALLPMHHRYEVVFDEDVSQCAHTATLGRYITDLPRPGFIGVGRVGNLNAVLVETLNEVMQPDARLFHLVVNC